MSQSSSPPPERWSGRTGFILATVGSAVGIGSIWKFPYEVGANGGSAFVLFYLIGLALVVVPLLFAEFAIGRRGGADPITSIVRVARANGEHAAWGLAGALGILTGFLILSFYSVIGGWTIAYAFETLVHGLPGADAAAVRGRYDALLAAPWAMIGWHACFFALTALVVAQGVRSGIEAASKVLMPLLGLLMVALAAYSLAEGNAARGLAFLFRPDVEGFSARAAIEALGLGFFSIGVGLGLMITFAAYAGADIDLKTVAIASVVADTAVSLVAGIAVFPIVFAHGLDPAGGAGLVFVTLPLAFAAMPGGRYAAIAFFVLLFVAALASAMSMLELVVAMLVARRRWSRRRATLVAALACFVVGIPSALAFSVWSDWRPLGFLPAFADANFFTMLDDLTSNLLLPAGGLALAVFIGWRVPPELLAAELGLAPPAARTLRLLLRWVAPVAIILAATAPYFA